MKNFVSVIIPTLNEGAYIENTLKALKNQSYKGGYEIIVSDSLSEDRTIDIAKKICRQNCFCKKEGRFSRKK